METTEGTQRTKSVLVYWAFLSVMFLIFSLFTMSINNEMPRCPEDAVLIGAGNFEDGRWDYLLCGPPKDNYTP